MASNETPKYKLSVVEGTELKLSLNGAPGPLGPANTLSIGTVTTAETGVSAAATITGSSPTQTLNLTLPKGNTGATGPANVLSVASTTTSAAGTNALVTISGTSPSQSLSFSIPRGNTGATGPANTLSIGTVGTGVTPAVTITGTSPNQTLNFVLQKGDKGDTGDTGSIGPTGASSSVFPYFARTTSTSGDPSVTFITWNQSTQVNATFLNINHIGSDGNDYDVFLALIKQNDFVIVQAQGDSDKFQKFLVTGAPTIISNSYVRIPVTNDSFGTSPTNFTHNDPVLFIIQSIGPTGPTGPSNTLSIGTVTAGGIGVASATITGTSPNQTLNLVMPTGATGATGNTGTAATITVGSVATGAAGSSVTINNSGTSAAAVFDFSIPKGDTGLTGPIGPSIESLIITESTTARTLVLSDTNQYIRCTNVSQTFITVPPESAVTWTAGAVVYFRRATTAGAISLTAGAGVTINNGGIAPTIPVDQNFALKKVGTNIWDLI
jgi:hypothetical protein